MIETWEGKQGYLEKFGVYYLNLFSRLDTQRNVFDLSDEQLTDRVNWITNKGIITSSLVGMVCVFPTVWVDVHFAGDSFVKHYGWVAVVTLVSVVLELYVLFLISLKAVHEVSELINLHARKNELLNDRIFGVKNILARAALELPDPKLKILGIDPFERVSKKSLLILGLLYKAKIFVSNLVLKRGLQWISGNTLLGVPVLFEAIPVEAFWNSVVIKRVVHQARLRLFGFALANEIANNVIKEHTISQLSHAARIGCLRAIGNAVVMARNYHPNMIILLLRFQALLKITEEHQYDDCDKFLETLSSVDPKEKNFLLDLFTVAAAFDGRISHLEQENLQSVYGSEYELYHPRLVALTQHLRDGQLHAALALCRLDFLAG